MKKPFISLRWKIMLPLLAVFGLAIIVIALVLGVFLNGLAYDSLASEIDAIAWETRGCLDTAELEQVRRTPGRGAPASTTCLEGVMDRHERAVLISYFLNDNDQLQIGLNPYSSGEGINPGDVLTHENMAAYFGEFEDDGPYVEELMRLGLQEPAYEYDYFTYEDDQGGEIFFIGYEPIASRSGLIVFVYAGDLVTQIDDFQYLLFFSLLAGLVLLAIFLFIFTGRITASIRKLERVSESIASGEYDQTVLPKPGLFDDEVMEMTRLIDDMAKKVYGRELKLVEQVTELKVFIDQDRRKEELEKVISSDFFQELQAKKRKMKESAMAEHVEQPVAVPA